jgi:DNA-binding transcriptional regulator YiaG
MSVAQTQADYYSKYYEQNKGRIKQARKDKYRVDKIFREKQQKRARDRARRLATEKREERAQASVHKARTLRAMEINLDEFSSQQVKRWPVGTLVTSSVICHALNISLGTLSNWVKKELIPEPTIRTSVRNYLFSVDYLQVVRISRIEALEQNLSLDEFKILAHKQYEIIRDKEEGIRKGGAVD